MSQLDAVVANMNVLKPMEYQWCVTFNRMLWFKYMVHVNFASSSGSTIHIVTLVGSKSHLLTVGYSAKNFGLVMNTAEG